MKAKYVLIIFLLFGSLFVAASYLSAKADAGPTYPRSTLTVRQADGNTIPFEIEVATTPAQQEHGLMFRTALGEHAGMLFIFPVDQDVSMWMKNTLIPLDMLFVTSDGTITHIAPDAVPQSEAIISSGGPVRDVVEIKGGAAARLGIHEGDKITSPALPQP
jgi:uncharacterized membrane protein (UPF0127 family)